MHDSKFEDVYFTLIGEMSPPYALPGIENAYIPGGECDRLYNEAMDAYERLLERLGVRESDPDVEIIIHNLLTIQHILCQKIYHYGKIL